MYPSFTRLAFLHVPSGRWLAGMNDPAETKFDSDANVLSNEAARSRGLRADQKRAQITRRHSFVGKRK